MKKKGKSIFIRDLSSCQHFSNQNIKRSEGSKGAGELQREKNFIFYRCMEKNYWILKEWNLLFLIDGYTYPDRIVSACVTECFLHKL